MSLWPKWIRKLGRSARNLAFDLRYGGFVGGYRRNIHPGATGTGATDYALMPQMFDGRIRPGDVLVDVGCGYGRVINWWLDQGHSGPIYGLELMEDVAAHTKHRLRKFKNVHILPGDALANMPPNPNVIYLANPFDWPEKFKGFLDELHPLIAHRADVTVVYFACVHVGVAKVDPRWAVEEVTLTLPDVGFFEERHRHLAIIRPRPVHPAP